MENLLTTPLPLDERAIRIDSVRNMVAMPVPAEAVTKEVARGMYKQIKERTNKNTGQKADFVSVSFKKIKHHRGFDLRVFSILANAFENAIFMYDEPVNTAHKVHTNFSGYSHYAVKIEIDGQPAYARFTLENLKTKKPGKAQKSQFHSVHLSYEEKNYATHPRVNSSIINLATWGANGTTDYKLQQWFNFVNGKSCF